MELFGWLLYGLILAFGQVHRLFGRTSGVTAMTDHFGDVERDQLLNRLTLWFEQTDRHPTVRPWFSLLRCFGCLVPASRLGHFRPLVLLRCRLPPHWAPLRPETHL